jgi:hypothetical protein
MELHTCTHRIIAPGELSNSHAMPMQLCTRRCTSLGLLTRVPTPTSCKHHEHEHYFQPTMINFASKNIISTLPNHSESSGPASSSTHSIGAYIDKVFKNPYSTLLLLLLSHQCKWELPSLSSSSLSSSSPPSVPQTTPASPMSLSSTAKCECQSNYSDCDGNNSSKIHSTEEWFNHCLVKKKTRSSIIVTKHLVKRDSLHSLLGIFEG